jgi:general secretion pathway protein G
MGYFCHVSPWDRVKTNVVAPADSPAFHGPFRHIRGADGLTVAELTISLVIVTAVAIVAIPAICSYVDDIQTTEAVSRLTAIELSLDKYYAENGKYPDSLAQVGKGGVIDPWGHPYIYMPLPEDGKVRAEMGRRLREVRILNTDYDLCSPGKDGKTDLSLNKKRCWDDVVRAYNGSYTGVVRDIL